MSTPATARIAAASRRPRARLQICRAVGEREVPEAVLNGLPRRGGSGGAAAPVPVRRPHLADRRLPALRHPPQRLPVQRLPADGGRRAAVRSRGRGWRCTRRHRPAFPVRHLIEGTGGGPQFVVMAGQGAAGFGRGFIGSTAGAVVEQGALFEGADDGAHPFLDGFAPALGCSVRFGGARGVRPRCGAGCRRGSRRRRRGSGAELAQPQAQCDQQQQHHAGERGEADPASRRGLCRRVQQRTDVVPEPVEDALEESWIVLVVLAFREFAFGRFACGRTGRGDRYAAVVAGGRCCEQAESPCAAPQSPRPPASPQPPAPGARVGSWPP